MLIIDRFAYTVDGASSLGDRNLIVFFSRNVSCSLKEKITCPRFCTKPMLNIVRMSSINNAFFVGARSITN